VERRREGPPVLLDRSALLARARIGVRGLARDPELGQRLVGSFGQLAGVRRVSVSRLTGRLLIEFDEHQVAVEDLVAQLTGMELPDLPEDDCPTHPLDRAPLIQSGMRAAGALTGLGVIGARRVAGAEGPPVAAGGPLAVAAVVGVLEGLPPLRRAVFAGLGRDRAELLVGAVNVVALSFAGSPLGLAVSAAVALRRFTEIQARRDSWREYEERLADAQDASPGQTIRLRAGERAPLAGKVIEGAGTMIGRDGLPQPLGPGDAVTGGARVSGGPFVLELTADDAFAPLSRPVPLSATHLDHYLQIVAPVSIAYAALTAVLTRSATRTMTALLLVNARPALIGDDAAEASASTRVLRAGVTVVSTRFGRSVRMPGVLLVDGPRVLSDRRLEVAHVSSLRADLDSPQVLAIAAGIAAASGSPWGPAFPVANRANAHDGVFEAGAALAQVGRLRLRLRPCRDLDAWPEAARQRERGNYVLVVSREVDGVALGLVALRPRLEAGAAAMLAGCEQRGVRVELLAGPDLARAEALAARVGLPVSEGDGVEVVRRHQRDGQIVAFLSDSPHAARAFAAADLAIALTSGRSGHFAARADVLAPDLGSVGIIIKAAALKQAASHDAIALSAVSNVAGAVWGLRGRPGIERGSYATYVTALAAIGLAVARLSGGKPSRSATARLIDPEPERWGRPALAEVFRQLDSSREGLSRQSAATRAVQAPALRSENPLTAALGEQLRSPLNGALMAGAGISLMFGAVADVALIASVILANTAVGVWQEHQAGRVISLLAQGEAATVSVLRDGASTMVKSHELVSGDVISLSSGDRVPADARIIQSDSLEVDEAALTGESLPVTKDAEDPSEAGRVLLDGSDITVGSVVAVVFATGRGTRMGATVAALAAVEPARGALDSRLNRLVRQSLPVVLGGSGVIALSALAWRRPLAGQLAVAASVATAAVPEGLPLLAGVAEAAVARRLAGRNAFVRRLAAVEALGRVNVACTDKTGTLTAGRLKLTAVETFAPEHATPEELRDVLLSAALASPHPDAPGVGAHPTDVAVLDAAREHGLDTQMRAERDDEVPFDPARGFHSSVLGDRLLVKGAAESLAPRCTTVRRGDRDQPLGDEGTAELLDAAERLASNGLRVLMVAEGTRSTAPEDPEGLVAIGLIGISDPLRDGVPAAIVRCHQAAVRVIMLTGDHPATARAVAEQAGLRVTPDAMLTGAELADLDDYQLDQRLERATVIARITPLDKLRIVERLQASGNTVAMTGDGVNDAPALRLADVGVAMGLRGTEVARQASDVVLADDDFATLVEMLVEGRSFWLNLRRSLGLLLGGNLGELGMIVGASLLGHTAPLTTRQILTVNLITDTLPAVAVAAQQPENRDLTVLAREGGGDSDAALRSDILRRGLATAGPALTAYVLATRLGSLAHARTVAFGAITATQLGQTLSLGRAEGALTPPVLAAVAGSGGFTLAAMYVPPIAGFLGLTAPTIPGILLIAGAAIASVLLAGGVGEVEHPLRGLPRPRALLGAGASA
jgi:calcium-translocating P-type ATPase